MRKEQKQGEGIGLLSSTQHLAAVFKNLNALNNPFALGIFSGSAKKSSYIAQKDDS